MCSGRVDLGFILRAFSNGTDAVCIIGCWPGECNYATNGNYHALSMVHFCKRLLEHIGINPERLMIDWCNSSQGIRFVELMNNFSKKVKQLGPLGQDEGIDRNELKAKLEEVRKLVPYIKLVKKEKFSSCLTNLEEYDKLFTKEEIEELLREIPSYYIDPKKCQACMICLRRCPVEAIIGGKKQIHVIDQEKCIKCGTCFEACPPRFGAVRKLTDEPVPPPIPEEKRAIIKKSKEAHPVSSKSDKL